MNLYRQAIAQWLGALSPRTQRSYEMSACRFAEHAGVEGMEAALEMVASAPRGRVKLLLDSWITAMQEAELAANTINLRICAIRSWLKAAREYGLCEFELSIRRLRATPVRDTAGPCASDVDRVIAATASPRTRAVLCLLFDLGLRAQEVLDLDYEHVDLKADTVSATCKGKGNERELHGLPARTRSVLACYMNKRGCEPGPLFPSIYVDCERLSYKGLYALVTKAGAKLGLKLRPHGLRHSAITELVNMGESAPRIAAYARHADTRQIMRHYMDNKQETRNALAKKVADSRRNGMKSLASV